ncbi:hypothetical protein Tco_1094354 [Tanacetum coccineum]|uniref:Uncharacterized protein n=1 Tax=Tanacetum coccineum TaxID=301880 RepID=A0ABQ5IF96_9ASTR
MPCDSALAGCDNEDRLKLDELMALCTTLQNRVLDLEKTKTTLHNEIASLKRRVKKLEKKDSRLQRASRRNERMDDVRRIEEEVDLDFLSDAHNRTGPVESGDSCEMKVKLERGAT